MFTLTQQSISREKMKKWSWERNKYDFPFIFLISRVTMILLLPLPPISRLMTIWRVATSISSTTLRYETQLSLLSLPPRLFLVISPLRNLDSHEQQQHTTMRMETKCLAYLVPLSRIAILIRTIVMMITTNLHQAKAVPRSPPPMKFQSKSMNRTTHFAVRSTFIDFYFQLCFFPFS